MGRSGVSWAVWAGLGVGMKHRQARAARNSVRRALPSKSFYLGQRGLREALEHPLENWASLETREREGCLLIFRLRLPPGAARSLWPTFQRRHPSC